MARPKYYESDLTKLIHNLLRATPAIVEDQAKGRAMWWDKLSDEDIKWRAKESRVDMQPYVYQTANKP